MDPYNAGLVLRDLDNRPAIGLDVRGSGTAVTLTVTVSSERGSGQTVVDMYQPDEALELADALRTAANRMAAAWAATGVAS